MATPPDEGREQGNQTGPASRMGEGYFILGMAVQVGLVGLVGLALVGVQGFGFLTLGTAVALAGLSIGILAVGSILTLASLRHTLNVQHTHGQRIDRLAERVGQLAQDLTMSDEEVGWTEEEMELAPQPGPASPTRGQETRRQDPRDRKPSPRPGSPPNPLERGQVHEVADLPGIGHELAEQLKEIDIEDTRQLAAGNRMYIAGHLGEDPGRVETWQTMAELMAVEGIEAEDARTLARAGVGSLSELRHETPERLMRRIEASTEPEEAEPVGPQQAHAWIQAARDHEIDVPEPEQGPEAEPTSGEREG